MTEQEVLDFVEENDVKFIRLAFVDLFGTLKNISIMPTQLHRALSGSVSFDASAVKGFCDISHSELFLRPDPKTITLLPWRPQTGRVARMMCDCLLPDGTLFTGYSRSILRQQVEKAKSLGLTFQIGTEYEFYLFQSDDAGEVTLHPQDCAGYMDVSPLDKGENVRRDICLTLENMGIIPESSHHEHGPGQNEIDFQYAGALKAADNAMSFKTTVRTIANQYGLCASFLPKPLRDESGNGLHINLSIERGGSCPLTRSTPSRASSAESAKSACSSIHCRPAISGWAAGKPRSASTGRSATAASLFAFQRRIPARVAWSFVRPTLPATRIWRSRWCWRRPWRASPRLRRCKPPLMIPAVCRNRWKRRFRWRKRARSSARYCRKTS